MTCQHLSKLCVKHPEENVQTLIFHVVQIFLPSSGWFLQLFPVCYKNIIINKKIFFEDTNIYSRNTNHHTSKTYNGITVFSEYSLTNTTFHINLSLGKKVVFYFPTQSNTFLYTKPNFFNLIFQSVHSIVFHLLICMGNPNSFQK